MNKYLINLNTDNSEKVNYDSAEYFSYVRKGFLSSYPNYACLCHWHEDIELIYILNGEMSYKINSDVIKLKKNDGLFVNSRQLHYGFSSEKRECEFLCILLHPVLLCITTQMENRFITPVIQNSAMPYILLDNQVEWHRKVNKLIQAMYNDYDQSVYPLQLQGLFYQLWTYLFQNMPQGFNETTTSSSALSSVKQMIHYIEVNYSTTIKIKDLAKVIHVSESKCFQLFHSYLGQTPVEYVTRVRLAHGIELMKNSFKSFTEISEEIGFSNPSYFSESFKKYYNTTPREYRKNMYP